MEHGGQNRRPWERRGPVDEIHHLAKVRVAGPNFVFRALEQAERAVQTERTRRSPAQ